MIRGFFCFLLVICQICGCRCNAQKPAADKTKADQNLQLNFSDLDPKKAKKTKLANGIELLVFENHFAPMVYFSVCVMSGGMDDPAGKSGVAHYLEHLMFKGTTKYPKEKLFGDLLKNSATINAYTAPDRTVFWEYGPKEHLELFADIESNRFKESAVPPAEALNERRVVLEEARMYERQVRELLSNYLSNALCLGTPLQRPLAGWLPEVSRLTLDDATLFKRNNYCTENTKIIVVGDVSFDQVARVIEKYFGDIPRSAAPSKAYDEENAKHYSNKTFLRLEKYSNQFGHPVVSLAWQPDVCYGKDLRRAIALELFLNTIAGDDISWLYQELVEKHKVAAEIGLSAEMDLRHPYRIEISASPTTNTKMRILEKRLLEAVKQKCLSGLTAEEFALARNRRVISIMYAMQGYMSAGWYFETMFADDAYLKILDILKTLTVDFVNQVARECLLRPPVAIVVMWPDSQLSAVSANERR
ncbi:MAG: insulinase family protein [Holosporales bacterium]|jgi:zinc protease|nr:insulinase family protein [Holosporales bacterium]